jgi:putative aminopeptidase FrvX
LAKLPKVDMDYVVDLLVKLTTTPSPSGYTGAVMALLEEEFGRICLPVRRTNKGGLLATIAGRDDDNHRLLSGHVDTLGAMVKEIRSSGRLRYAPIGGASAHSVEGEYCTIITDSGRRYTGTILTTKAASHVYGKEAQDLERKPENMEIRLDEKVKNAAETRALGIEVGDFVAFDPRTQVTPSGFVKTRHLDDKASVAAIVGVARCLLENNLAPAATTHLFISNFEEVGHGAAGATPPKTKEFIAVDMGCVGEGIQADEYCVSICAKDSSGPYDAELKRRLVALAKENGIPYAVDVYPYYGSDASAALRAGADVRAIVIGPGVDASHSFERTHREGLKATADLLVAYLLE